MDGEGLLKTGAGSLPPGAGGAPELVRLRLPRDTAYLSLVRLAVVQVAMRVGFVDDDVHKIELAVDEACSNAVLHGPSCPADAGGDAGAAAGSERHHASPGGSERLIDEIELSLRAESDRITITIAEPGEPYPFNDRGNFALEEHLATFDSGGLGIYIIKSFMDEVRYCHRPDFGNELTMVKLLPSDTAREKAI